MEFTQSLIEGVLIKRYKRFLADVQLQDGKVVTAHTPNTGSMKGCSTPGSRVWLSQSNNPNRKFPLSWELVEVAKNILVGINTLLPNTLAREGIEQGIITELKGYDRIRKEVPYGREGSRIDLLLQDDENNKCFVEVKNVTLVEGEIAFFPDAVSQRAAKHLRELEAMVKKGHRSVILYCVQRKDAREVRPADSIDPDYGQTLRKSIDQGVEAIAYQASVSTRKVEIANKLPVVCVDYCNG
jgi:sugar fermentation stimulation protein A